MAVKCLTPEEKVRVAADYQAGWEIQQIAQWNGVSPRTISRVLAEANLLTPTERIDADMKKIRRIMDKYGITVDTLDATLSILKGTKNAS